MTYKEKNVVASLICFSLILVVVFTSLIGMVRTDTLTSDNVFGLWVTVIVLAVVAIILLTIATHIVGAIIEAIRTRSDDPKIDDTEDERDRLIDLRGTRATYFVTSTGGFLAMLTYVVGFSPLVMFSLLILFGVLGQVLGDIYRLILYRRGF
jgi:hypothetical protein